MDTHSKLSSTKAPTRTPLALVATPLALVSPLGINVHLELANSLTLAANLATVPVANTSGVGAKGKNPLSNSDLLAQVTARVATMENSRAPSIGKPFGPKSHIK